MLLCIRDKVRVGSWHASDTIKAGMQYVLPADKQKHTFSLFYTHYRNPQADSCGFAVALGRKMLPKKKAIVYCPLMAVSLILISYLYATFAYYKTSLCRKLKRGEAKEESGEGEISKKPRVKTERERCVCVCKIILTLFFPLTVHFSTSFVFQVNF